jgi:hypothetical protein
MQLLRAYMQLTKTGIILFSVVSALAGYAVSFQIGQEFDALHPILLVIGLYFVAGGGFALNQAQEWAGGFAHGAHAQAPDSGWRLCAVAGLLRGLVDVSIGFRHLAFAWSLAGRFGAADFVPLQHCLHAVLETSLGFSVRFRVRSRARCRS